MSYRLAILNDCECPEPRMVILTRERDGTHEWAYVSAWRDLDAHRGWHPLKFPERVTELSEFGVCPVIELSGGEHVLHVEKIGPSRAQYSDGHPRKWQAQLGKRTIVLPAMLSALIEYQRESNATKHTDAEKA